MSGDKRAAPSKLADGTDAVALSVILDEAKGGGWKPDDGTSLWFYNEAGDQLRITGDDVALLLAAALAALDDETAERILIAHQRHTAQSCLCGWSQLGASHSAHQWRMLKLGRLAPQEPTPEEPA